MAAAYVLTGELSRSRGDHATAFLSYQSRLKDMIDCKQRAATKFGAWFAPQCA